MAGDKTVETTGLLGWIDKRFTLTKLFIIKLS
jgi:ubiquinol-cytochrome c reductase cytochrome b subunit